jgi:transmembrane sensor
MRTPVTPRGRPQDDIDAAAAEWIVRIGAGPLPDDERSRLDCWLAENPANRAAFNHAQSLWAELAAIKIGLGKGCGATPAKRRRLRLAGGSGGTVGTALRCAAAACAMLLVMAGAAVFWFGDPMLLLAADYRTAPGVNRDVILPDGTRVDLDSGSALAVRFDDRERRIALLAGEAYFIVAPEVRPFLVEAANGTAKALGTEFAVDRRGDTVSVIVARHRVRVAAIRPDRSEAGSVVLSPGQSINYDRQARMGPVTRINVDSATSWRRGYLVFDNVRLADVVAELNRYRRGRIVIGNHRLAERRVSGVFHVGELAEGLTAIARELGAGLASLPPFVTLLY